ncbi:MAG: protein-tyrosine-phosphatase [Lachnospiraceae bacterium]|nr:protein-tyrosine-phosphatase [Lachnospiraceae bacterium]
MKFKEKRRIIDIHSHILPGIDDGSNSWETSVEMLKTAEAEGITDMIATPHYKPGHRNAPPHVVKELAARLQSKLRELDINVRIHTGNEIMYFSEAAEKLDRGEILTMCDSDFVLVEFMPGDNFRHISGSLDELRYMGYIPILAHVERYECMISELKNVEELARRDVKMQINAASYTGALGHKVKKAVMKMVDNGYIDYIGTDSHDTKRRAPYMAKCMQMLDRRYIREDVDVLTCINALDIIEYNQ